MARGGDETIQVEVGSLDQTHFFLVNSGKEGSDSSILGENQEEEKRI